MSRIYRDPVDVQGADGRPVRFTWRGQPHTVRRVTEHWVTTSEWWRHNTVPGADPGPVETREFWRVEASVETTTDVCVYELRHDQADDAWLLSRAWD
ncbi:MAG TPA: DUF6504 family protein [Streptosporangiaceae bacterium]|jgi:hypothetical protein|nr:DUF6504 family protein [Streptosporangiaceae bacterium]